MSLAGLLNQATPGPWEHRGLGVWGGDGKCEIAGFARHTAASDFDLIALAPDMARLLIDMADFLRDEGYTRYGDDEPGDELLARFAALNAKAGGTT